MVNQKGNEAIKLELARVGLRAAAANYADAVEETAPAAAMELEQAAIVFVEALAEQRRRDDPMHEVLLRLAEPDNTDPMAAAARRTLERVSRRRGRQ